MAELSQGLYDRCYQTLLKCSEFDSDNALRAVFVVRALAAFRDGLPGGNSKADRVKSVIAYLLEQESPTGEPALLLFLRALSRNYSQGMKLHHDLNDLACAAEDEISEQRVITSSPVPVQPDKRALIQRLRDPYQCSIGDLQRLWQDYGNPSIAFQILVTQCSGVGNLQACLAEHLVMEATRRGQLADLGMSVK